MKKTKSFASTINYKLHHLFKKKKKVNSFQFICIKYHKSLVTNFPTEKKRNVKKH